MQQNAAPTVTFVNRFTVKGDPGEFERAFGQVADFMAAQPGILGYTLSQDVGNPNRYVNVALWESLEALRTAVGHPDFTAHVSELRRLADSDSEVYAERLRRDPE